MLRTLGASTKPTAAPRQAPRTKSSPQPVAASPQPAAQRCASVDAAIGPRSLFGLPRPAVSLGLGSLGGCAMLATLPSLAAAYMAAPVLTKLACFAGVTSVSWALTGTPAQALGALTGLLAGVAATCVFAPAALPVAYLFAGVTGAAFGSMLAQYAERLHSFLHTTGGVLVVAVFVLALVALYVANRGYAAP